MSKHTQGPWEILNTLEICAGKKDICEMKGWMNEDQANARLIAAAPDLLNALEDLVSLAEVIMRENGEYMVDDELTDARNAIAKAKGEA